MLFRSLFVEPHERLRALRLKRGLTQEELGLAVGFDIGQARQRVSKLETNKQPMTTDHLRKFADALHTTPGEILEGELPPRGSATSRRAGGVVVNTVAEQGEAIPLVAYGNDGRHVVGYVERPPSLRGVRHAYALYVFDDRMEPRYVPGWLLYVNPTKPPHVGRDVFVVRRAGMPLVRQLERQTCGEIVLRALVDDERIILKQDEVAEMHLIIGADQEG